MKRQQHLKQASKTLKNKRRKNNVGNNSNNILDI